MIYMQINGLSKSFGSEEIFSNIKMEIKDQDRVAIVGRNGTGKSTLLKIIAGELSYDEGEIIKPKDLTIGYLAQHMELESGKTIWDEMIEVFQPLLEMEKRLRILEQKMEQATSMSPQSYEKLLKEYDELLHKYQSDGGYIYESEIKAVLNGLQFQHYDYDTPISELSGGQKTRLALGKLLLLKPNLLILDEPTNHLDIDTLSWLENYLLNYPGAIVIVSHDRYFLDKIVKIVYEISRKKMTKYYGTYSKYLEQKAVALEKQLKEYEKQQEEIRHMEEFIQRNIVRASTTKRAQSRRKQLEKMERMEKPVGSEASARFSFQIERRSGNDVLKMDDVAFRYEGESKDLFQNISLRVNRGDRIAIVGPNGAGKTTLLKLIIGKEVPANGVIKLGTNVQIAYYDQEQAELSSNKSVLNELWDDYPTMNERDIRTILGNFLFSGDDVLKEVHTLSGGEKARLALAKLMMKKANLLILDEPTNHLDIDSKEVLEEALLDYPGTIIFVSHDRYFINKITSQVAELRTDELRVYLGDYDYYIEKKREEEEIALLENKEIENKKKESNQKGSYEREKQIQSEMRKKKRRAEQLERDIERLEKEIAEVEELMTKPEVYEDHMKALEMNEKLEQLKQEADIMLEEWTELQEELS